MEDPWCVLGDFNTMLRVGERFGGVDVTDRETRDFASCLHQSGLEEFPFEGAFFTWTNKTVWSRIDRAFHNDFWFNCSDYTHVGYKSQGLSDHTPIILSFPQCPKPVSSFQFCEMWTKDRSFKDIVVQGLQKRTRGSSLKDLQHVLNALKPPLRRLNRSKYADIYQ